MPSREEGADGSSAGGWQLPPANRTLARKHGIRVCGFCSLKPPPCGASRPAGNACVGVWPAGAAGAGGVSAAGEHGRASHTKFLTNSKRDAPRRGAENFQQTLEEIVRCVSLLGFVECLSRQRGLRTNGGEERPRLHGVLVDRRQRDAAAGGDWVMRGKANQVPSH